MPDKGGIFGLGLLGSREKRMERCHKSESAFSQIKRVRLDLDVTEADVNLAQQITGVSLEVKKGNSIYQQGVKILRVEVLERK